MPLRRVYRTDLLGAAAAPEQVMLLRPAVAATPAKLPCDSSWQQTERGSIRSPGCRAAAREAAGRSSPGIVQD